MKEQLNIVLNTLALISTKGDDTLRMAGVVQLLQQLVAECDAPKQPSIPEEHKEV